VKCVGSLLAGEIDRCTMDKRYFTAAGLPVWVKLSASLVRDPQGRPRHFIAQIEDIVERKRLQEELQRLADHDSLTALWNRRRFDEELHRQVSRCQRFGEQAALILLDLDRFKPVNDVHGHAVGDQLLKKVASALREHLRITDSLARLGGDEFAIILVNIGPEQAARVAAEFGQCVAAARISIAGGDIGVGASIGMTMLTESTPDADESLRQADIAMYEAKGDSRREVDR
jgi:diguanylate cyclase (GGDEF)-like protein